ncbi:hypothetical protein [Streptomyces canus]|uniref:hypothetical protein n=1 Tax=Streptomyces canus TaxID=58343 RepID=UPI0033B56597
MRLRPILATAVALIALTACSSTDQPTAVETVTVRPAPEPTPTLDDDMTALVVDLSWSQQTEDDKDAMCLGVGLYGPEWAAEQMATGAGDDSIDWQRAAELVEQKCAER